MDDINFDEEVAELADSVTARLGESPEAWRGAAAIINLTCSAASALEDTGPDDFEKNAARVFLLLLYVMRAIDQHPVMQLIRNQPERDTDE